MQYVGRNESDKKSIHKAIKSQRGGFELIDESVERIRLEYLLQYPFEKIKGRSFDSEAEKKEQRREGVKILASSIVIMVERVHSLKDEIPEFEEYLEQKLCCWSSEPINAFRKWKCNVENLIEEKNKRNDHFLTNPNI